MRDSTKIFVWTHYDPAAVFGGVHHWLVGDKAWTGAQLGLLIAGCVLAAELSATVTHYKNICCYSGQSPSAAEYANGGSCAEPGTVSQQYGDTDLCAGVPTSQILLGVFAGVALVGAVLVYMLTFRPYMRKIRGHVKYYLHAAGCSDAAEEIEEDANANGGHTLFAMAHYVMLYPVVGILLGMHEKAIGRFGLYYARLIMLMMGVLFYFLMDAMLDWNKAWGCYPTFRGGIENIDRLFYGRCDDYRSIAYSWDGGMVGNWLMGDIFMVVFGVCVIGWTGIYCLRWTGLVLKSGRVLVERYCDSFIATVAN